MIDLLLRVLEFATPILALIALGLFGAGILMEMGLVHGLSRLTRPIFSLTRLPVVCASAFVVALGSAVAANGMVARFRDDGLLDEKEVILCAIMNSIPVYIRDLFTYQLPIVLPALGLLVGGLYAGVFVITALVKITAVVVLSRLLLDEDRCKVPEPQPPQRASLNEAVVRVFRRERRLFFKIATIYLSMTTLVFVLIDRGGGISAVQAMTVLMLGSLFMLPLFAVRSLLPRYVAIFGPRLGPMIVLFSTGSSMLIRFVILVVLLIIA